MSYTISLLPGDGIGPEVAKATKTVIDASGIKIDWVEVEAGAACAEKTGELIPQKTLDTIDQTKLCLKGPITTPVGKGFKSLNVTLRQKYQLYASVRPIKSIPGIKTRFENVNLVVVRENTEGLYAGIENEISPGVMVSMKVATEKACLRIAQYAFDYVISHGRKKVTAFHKANIMKLTDGLFVNSARRISEKYTGKIEFNDLIIDNACMQMVKDPTQFDVLVMENLYGDVVSDLCAGLVGGLGVVPGANIGQHHAIFEAVHGSAPDIAGKGLANPLALIMSGVMMLRHINQHAAADKIEKAYNAVIGEGNPEHLTRDIGGKGSTNSFVDAILKKI
ncbi:MAG: isocitrate/isopropylmalate dehydrogenase family protein [Proteobacteria bacterium]|jgi:isocitrate dehydrogenase (NAD+)|nr:isocitrate/isopropylmalate dehydrogenase family protein [Pseudomonadota bacterium]